jgi:hypothetical protein
MLKKRRDAASKVANELFALERAIDQALVRAAGLNAVMPTAWAEANLSVIVGHEAFEGATAVFAALARARQHVIETHIKLDETKTRVGLRAVSFGDQGKIPPSGLTVVPVEGSIAA